MQSRVDELTSDAHLKMTFVEFMEALGRAADYLSLAPPSDKVRELYLTELHSKDLPKEETEKEKQDRIQEDLQMTSEGDENQEDKEGADLTESEHSTQPLHKKIENIIPYLLAY